MSDKGKTSGTDYAKFEKISSKMSDLEKRKEEEGQKEAK